MKRKLTGLLLSAAMAISLLSGCGNDASSNKSEEGSAPKVEEETGGGRK
nr:hypothetical protein [uncultured Acetatifactor sp.]